MISGLGEQTVGVDHQRNARCLDRDLHVVEVDLSEKIELVHRARGRAGFAKGAVWAAERIAGRAGVYEFGELLKEVS